MTESSDDNRQHRKKEIRSKRNIANQREYCSSDSDTQQQDIRKKRRHRKKEDKKKKSRRRDDSDSASSDHHHHRRRRHRKKHNKKRRSKYEYSSSDESSSSGSSDDEPPAKKAKRKKSSKLDATTGTNEKPKYQPGILTFGTYGILKASDYHSTKVQRSFEAWMGEVKGIPSFTGAKWELTQYFAEFMEDFNTCTFPHEKYFDYDTWEQSEYDRAKLQDQALKTGTNTMLADEAHHRDVMKKKQQLLKQQEMQLLQQTMTLEKVQDMKHQQQLQSEMRHAYKVGDEETRKRLARKLEPTEDDKF